MIVNFQLTGRMPLLMHADDVEAGDRLQAWRKDPGNRQNSVAGDDRSPAWTWQTYVYSDGDQIVIPSCNIMVALRQAGAQIILKKQKTFKEVSQSGLLILSEFCPLTVGGKAIPIASVEKIRDLPFDKQSDKCRDLGFRLFVKRATVGKAKHVRVRPRFDKWEVKGQIEILNPAISFEVLEQLFELAGRVGLCDWRPGCKTPGPFGQFSAELSK